MQQSIGRQALGQAAPLPIGAAVTAGELTIRRASIVFEPVQRPRLVVFFPRLVAASGRCSGSTPRCADPDSALDTAILPLDGIAGVRRTQYASPQCASCQPPKQSKLCLTRADAFPPASVSVRYNIA